MNESNFVGLEGREEWVVEQHMLACAVKSGDLEVFSTPFMLALMEYTAASVVASKLEAGTTTVGTMANFKHIKATPFGARVWAEAKVVGHDRRMVDFSIEVFDEAGKIGEGTHQRFIVDGEKFMSKLK